MVRTCSGLGAPADVDGVVTALRYFKPIGATGTHTGSLWTAGGVNLAQAVFTNETASGWQEVTLPTPIAPDKVPSLPQCTPPFRNNQIVSELRQNRVKCLRP